ncbi:MAG: NAD(P)-dependent glycerol-3-phosphate dehydrogenase [Magnetococcales bacterium]|nr:NAD(P)-dependent glycerol-3-phosphate dehydrogenase [Magnetococcales bacterium]
MPESTVFPASVSVIGAGSWGTALAALLAAKRPVTLWCREPEVAESIREFRHNPLFVSEFTLPPNLHATTDLAEAARAPLLVMAPPAQFTRSMLAALLPLLTPETAFVSVSKGIEVENLTLISQMYDQVLGVEWARRTFCCLSGPSFARDVLRGLPTAVVAASANLTLAEEVQRLFHAPSFRTYRTDDVVGVELGGALKNVIAIAAGISDGLGFGASARAALVTRGLAEMIRLGARLGGKAETFAGLSGLGDLLLTSGDDMSRNRTVGKRLGAGEPPEAILTGSREVAEGVKTAQAVHRLAGREGVEMPICRAVHDILYQRHSPREAVRRLMERELKAENA